MRNYYACQEDQWRVCWHMKDMLLMDLGLTLESGKEREKLKIVEL